MKKSELKNEIKNYIYEILSEVDVDPKSGAVVMKKGTNPNDIKKVTAQGIDVELREESFNEDDYDLIRSEVDVDRKPYSPEDVDSKTDFNSLSPKIQQLIKSLPIYDIESEIFEDDAEGFYIDGLTSGDQYAILNINNQYFFVDTQGYDYARYVGEILNFPNDIKKVTSQGIDVELREDDKEPNTQIPTIDDLKKLTLSQGIKINIGGKEYKISRYSDNDGVSYHATRKEDNQIYDFDTYNELKKFIKTGITKVKPRDVSRFDYETDKPKYPYNPDSNLNEEEDSTPDDETIDKQAKAAAKKEKIQGPSKFKYSNEEFEDFKTKLKNLVKKIKAMEKGAEKDKKMAALKQFIKKPELVKAFKERDVQIDTGGLVGENRIK